MVTSFLQHLASLRLSLVLIGATAGLLVYNRLTDEPVNLIIAVPLSLLCANLVAAIVVNPKLRSQGGLLVFHVALAVLMILAAGGRLMTMKGHVEVTEGTKMDPVRIESRVAPFYPGGIDEIDFLQGNFRIDYLPELDKLKTYSDVFLPDGKGGRRVVELVGDKPLLVDGHRFFPTSNKGFAVIVSFIDGKGGVETSAVHMPSYPVNAELQANIMTIPGVASDVHLRLVLEETIMEEQASWSFRTPKNPTLQVTVNDTTTALKLGGETMIAGGVLHFDQVRTWMGYSIFYDPSIMWVLGASLIAVLGLAWHIIGKFRAIAWDQE